MSGAEIPLILGAVSAVGTAGAAYSQFQGAKQQSKMGLASVALQREQARLRSDTTALAAREKEVERRRKAGLVEGNSRAASASAGIDMEASGTVGAFAADNAGSLNDDLANIRLGALNGEVSAGLEERALSTEAATYRAIGANAWIKPAGTLLSGAAQLQKAR